MGMPSTDPTSSARSGPRCPSRAGRRSGTAPSRCSPPPAAGARSHERDGGHDRPQGGHPSDDAGRSHCPRLCSSRRPAPPSRAEDLPGPSSAMNRHLKRRDAAILAGYSARRSAPSGAPRRPRRPGARLFPQCLLAWPGAGRLVEGLPAGVVRRLLDCAEDGALDGTRQEQLAPPDVPVLGVRRILRVDEPPDLVEDLLRRPSRRSAILR